MKKIAIALACLLLTSCASTATYKKIGDGEYEFIAKGKVSSTIEVDGLKASIDSKSSNVFKDFFNWVFFHYNLMKRMKNFTLIQ